MNRTRFAPSPTGYLHIGGLRTALYSYLFARKNGGKFILRIEDTDTERKVDGASEIIYRTLKDAGLSYDEGPDVGGEFGPYIQSERKALYLPLAERLVKNGGAYYCFCGKERLEQLKADGATKYDKRCAGLSVAEVKARIAAGAPYVIRQNIPEEGSSTYTDGVFGDITVENKDLEDGVLIKSDGMPTYNFANVVDDYLMGINYVIRGVEYLSSTPKYNYIYKGLGWELPNYIHLQPIMRDATHKLSKRYGDASYEDFIKKGYLSEAIVNYIALLGWSPKDNREKMTLEEMVELFSVDGLSKSASIFDEEKMKWLNAQYIREMSSEAFYEKALPFLEEIEHLRGFDLGLVAKLTHSRCELLSDVGKLTAFLNDFDNFDLGSFKNEKWKTDEATAEAMLPGLITVVSDQWPVASEADGKESTNHKLSNLHAALEAFALENGYKKGQVLWIFRIAITGSLVTPGGAIEMAELLGRERVLKRMQAVSRRLR
ncbi:MAG: glutamate--tRNA ligase [Firmicutes bacterium]|nr:glutamate--tRNA ligase [Bacillota bacterium]